MCKGLDKIQLDSTLLALALVVRAVALVRLARHVVERHPPHRRLVRLVRVDGRQRQPLELLAVADVEVLLLLAEDRLELGRLDWRRPVLPLACRRNQPNTSQTLDNQAAQSKPERS